MAVIVDEFVANVEPPAASRGSVAGTQDAQQAQGKIEPRELVRELLRLEERRLRVAAD